MAGLNSDGDVKSLRKQLEEANIPIKETTPKLIPEYVGKAKRAAQITAERGCMELDGLLPNVKKYSMNGNSIKYPLTKFITMDKATSVVRILQRCSNFQNEMTQLMFILDLLGVSLILAPKFHPEISG